MRALRICLSAASLVAVLCICSCASFEQGRWPDLADDACLDPLTPGTNDVPRMACAIDCLEKHIDKYGSIVPKHADVWGQSRLMMHRQEFERVMRADIYNFPWALQASVSTSDQAFLANALSLQNAVSSTAATSSATSLVAGPNDVVTREQLVQHGQLSNLVTPNGKLAIEPSLFEDQKKRYLDHLHELRRINEGDDNTDAPGYGLNLIRLPISVLTGACTQEGCGAECTITATPHLPDDLLPETFRDLVVNDLVRLLTLPITRILELTTEDDLQLLLDNYESQRTPQPDNPADKLWGELQQLNTTRGTPEGERHESRLRELENKVDDGLRPFYTKIARMLANANPTSPGRVNETPVPNSQVVSVFGAVNLAYLAQHVRKSVKDHLACKNAPYHLDVAAALKNELSGAYQFLDCPKAEYLWSWCGPNLAEAIRTQDVVTKIAMQEQFLHVEIQKLSTTKYTDPGLDISRSATSILAWFIMLDASLLNNRFIEDMKATQVAKGCPCIPAEQYPMLFLPHPPPETCQLFNEYVRCRWPLHVFALDPETEDQNVGDSFSLRRELQLALSVAFTSGNISANNFTRYVKRIEQDIDTIAINRTMIGFSHGDDSFGWRFYPRVQTPPIDGNFESIFRDSLLGGYGPKHDLRRRRLENGIRECDALVIMPSFVPYVDLEVTANWFRLADPKCKALNMKQTMRLSRAVKSLQDVAPALVDQNRYRCGDVPLMVRKIDQLSQRLPLQTQLVNVPFENTHGGFELLSTGVTDLAPELVGWYGAPGINPNGATSLFLVGNNFSVHQTRVIVGGIILDPSCQAGCTTTGGSPVSCACTMSTGGATSSQGSGAAPGATGSGSQTGVLPVPNPTEAESSLDLSSSSAECDSESGVTQAGLRCKRQPVRPPLPSLVVVNMQTPTPPASAGSGSTSAGSGSVSGSTSAGSGAGSGAGTGAATATITANPVAIVSSTNPVVQSLGTASAYDVPHFQMELLSRQVMRIILPAGVYYKDGFADVHIATPYGVSSHLSIPVMCSDTPTPIPNLLSLASDGTTATIRCCWTKDKLNPCDGKLEPVNWSPGTLALKWGPPKDLLPKTVRVQVAFQTPRGKLDPDTMDLPQGKSNSFNLSVSELTSYLLDKLSSVGQYKLGDPLPASIQGTITVLKTDGTPVYDAVGAVSQKLTVQFELVAPAPGLCPPPAP